jgi:hypothetical protein
LGSLAELRQVAMALAGGWAAAATEKGRAVVTVPMGGQHVLLAIRIDEYVRIGRAEAARFERPSKCFELHSRGCFELHSKKAGRRFGH